MNSTEPRVEPGASSWSARPWQWAAVVLHARFWFLSGTVDYVKGLVVQLPSGLAVVLGALYVVLVAAARRLGVRHWVAWFVVTPALLGQGIVGILYCSR